MSVLYGYQCRECKSAWEQTNPYDPQECPEGCGPNTFIDKIVYANGGVIFWGDSVAKKEVLW